MLKMRVLIVEDRQLAREELQFMLSRHPDIEVVAECEDTASAWPLIETGQVDGVFLDIDIETEGERAGLDLALRIQNIRGTKQPWIVFTTGRDEWALDAHQVRPFGYLLKPLKDGDLAQVLDKIRQAGQDKPVNAKRLVRIKYRKLIRGESLLSTKYVYADDIKYVRSDFGSDKVKVILASGEELSGVNETLAKWLEKVPELTQIHKSHLVNLKYADGYQPDPFQVDSYQLTFACCDDLLAIGRKHIKNLQDYFDGLCA